jgi:hypothetical protein
MSSIEVRYRRNEVWKALVGAVFLLLVLIFVLDDLPLSFWLIAAGVIISLVFTVDRAYSPEPLIVINDEGVFDRRLRVGVIRWADIRRIKLITLNRSLYFISLELHNRKTYESRRPLWHRLWSGAKRLYGIGSIAIFANGLDVDHDTLMENLHERCMAAAPGPATVEIR